MSAIREIPKCAICSEPAGQVCGGCRAEHYCGKVHQKQAWRAGHRLKCTSFRLDTNELLGRHFVATRDIKQGEIIMKEKPAIHGPKMNSNPMCLTCYKKLQPIKKDKIVEFYKCTRCGWPMCDESCQNHKIHKEECELMTSRKFKSAITYTCENKRESAYCVIAPLRCLLLQKTDPIQYEAIMSLESHLEERIDSPLYRILKANIVTFLHQVLGLTQFNEDTILKVAGILDTNAYEIKNKEKNTRLRALFLSASMRSHDCNPNTKHVFSDEDFTMTVIATIPISKGTLITTSYTQPLWGTLARRIHLQNAKCFLCTCKRCKDPTELGTYLGAIFCSRCYANNPNKDLKDIPKVISLDPLNNSSDWKCQSCSHTLHAKQITWGNEAIRKDIALLNKTRPKDLEEFIIKYEQALHPENFHVVEVKYALSQMYGHLDGYTYNGK